MSAQKRFSNDFNSFYAATCCLAIFFVVASCSGTYMEKQEVEDLPYLNTGLGVEERVDDLVSRMTLEEKIGQMVNDAPAIERLGIPQYNWWSEGLHGVARAGLATVFPQAIGLAATWDEAMMFDVSSAISDEARAKHHNFVRNDKRNIYQGLTIWSPNINIFRDPRWGRGQETYGEDPFLTGKLAVQFVKGLQGDDPKYFKTIATVKHLAVHSGPEPERHSFNAVTDERDLRQTYLPQFEMAIREAEPYSVMCAYNRYNGEACCGSDLILNDILRHEWDFDGFVVSDCGAIEDIFAYHNIVPTPEEAAALAVKAGTDLNCGEVYKYLKGAVEQGLITEEEIDVSVKRLFAARFRLGMFDPAEMVEYANIPYSVVDSKENQELALEAACKSIVLLKNENNTLPLKKDAGTVAVIGPNADQWLMLLGNYNGVPSDAITPLRGIKEKVSAGSKVLYAQGSALAEGMPLFEVVPAEVLYSPEGGEDVKVAFYNSRDLSGTPLYTETSKNIDANWFDKAPREDMDDDDFAVRWSGVLRPEESGEYQLGIIGTSKFRLFLEDSLVVKSVYNWWDEFGDPRLRKTDAVQLEKDQSYNIVVEAEERYADAQVQLVWARPQPDLKEQAIEVAKQADVVVMCMGLTARMEGEEMDVEIDGFRGGDRTKIDLPRVQQELIKEIQALGKPVVLVLLNGSALAVNWADENIPAIVEAWYPGQAAGQAIADVLFGDYNPGGRLPVTFYKSVEDLPPFEEYDISNQTYRYYQGEPLYPFGYGLSYTSFQYDDLDVKKTYRPDDTLHVSVKVKNTGKIAGDEVVQLYVSNLNASVPVPIRSLKGFKRVHLLPGEIKTIGFTIPAKTLSVMNDQNEQVVLPGDYAISAGGGQPDSSVGRSDAQVLKARFNIGEGK